jgi:hypothetical protein
MSVFSLVGGYTNAQIIYTNVLFGFIVYRGDTCGGDKGENK